MIQEPGSEAAGGHEGMGSSCSNGGRPSKAVLLGANACSPAFESLLLEALATARACEMASYHFRDA